MVSVKIVNKRTEQELQQSDLIHVSKRYTNSKFFQDCRNYVYVRNISGAFKETIVQGTCRKISAKSLPFRVLTTSPQE